MADPKLIDRALIGIAGAAVPLAGLLYQLRDQLKIFELKVEIDWYALLAFTLLPAFTVYYTLNRMLFAQREKLVAELREARAKHSNATQELALAIAAVHDRDALLRTDVVTRIPNQLQWVEDIKRISQESHARNPFQLIFIDLIGFKTVNDTFEFEVGDEVIRMFAEGVNRSMRRSESIYKNFVYADHDGKRTALDNDEMWSRIYRKYSGGDEFFIVIRGFEAEAVGFLNRLDADCRNVYTPKARKIMLDFSQRHPNRDLTQFIDKFELSFHGAVHEVANGATHESLLPQISTLYRQASEGSRMRVVWQSGSIPDSFPEGSFQRRVYLEAVKNFRKSSTA